MRIVMMMLVACAVVGTMTQNALAGGGGGTKKDATVKVTNKSTTETIAVIAFDPGYTPSANPFKDFLNNGGQFVQPGQTATFKTKAGAVTAFAQAYNNTGGQDGTPATTTVNVAKGKTASANVTFDGTNATFIP